MDWYYVDGGERRGPLSEPEFNELIRGGRVTAETQVWREGWANWAPLGEAGVQSATGSVAVASCRECGRSYPTSEMVQYEGAWVCGNCKPAFFQKVREGLDPTAEMVYGGFWIRFLAKFVDGIILGIVEFGVSFAFRPLSQNQSTALVGILAAYAVSFGIRLAYSTFMVGKYGATLGKLACGLRVVTASGSHVSYALACGRFFAEILSGLILCIGYIMAAFDDEKRALHDRICNTRVIRTGA